MIGYQAQVIPAMLAAFTLVYLRKILPQDPPAGHSSMIVVPFCSLVLSRHRRSYHPLAPSAGRSAPSSLMLSTPAFPAPSAWSLVLSSAFVHAPLVITGLHHMSNAIDMQLIADFGGTMLWPMIALSNIARALPSLGMIYLQRKKC